MAGHLLELNPKTFVGYSQFRGQVASPLNSSIAFPCAGPATAEKRRKDWSGQRRWRRPEPSGSEIRYYHASNRLESNTDHASGCLSWTYYVIIHGMSSMVMGVGGVCERAERMHRTWDKSG